MAKFSWTLEKIEDCSGNDITTNGWVTVSPTSGDELKESPKITVAEATKETDCQTATVILSLSNGEKEYINISRCVPECTCDMVNFTPGITTVDKDGSTTPIQIGTYTKGLCDEYINVSTDGLVLCKPTWSNGVIKATVNKNPHTSQRTGYYSFLFKGEVCRKTEVTQAAQTDSCINSTTCGSLVVSPTNYPTNGGTGTITITPTDCWVFVESSTTANWIAVNGATINVDKNKSKVSGRNGIISATFYNSSRGETCTKNVTITQTYTPICDCETVIPYVSTKFMYPASGYTCTAEMDTCTKCSKIADVEFKGDLSCFRDSSDLVVTVDITDYNGNHVDWVRGTLCQKSDNKYEYRGSMDANDSTDMRIAYLNLYINGVKCTNIFSPIKQQEATKEKCNCSEMGVTTSGKTNIGWQGGVDMVIANYSYVGGVETCEPEKIQCNKLSTSPWVSGLYTDTDRKEIRATISEYEGGDEEPSTRTADFMLIIDGIPCPTSKTITIKQSKKTIVPVYNFWINLSIANNNYGDFTIGGNQYGFYLKNVIFKFEDISDLTISVNNFLKKGVETSENLQISSQYNGKIFTTIQLEGYIHTLDTDTSKISTFCTPPCGNNKLEELDTGEHKAFKITMTNIII